MKYLTTEYWNDFLKTVTYKNGEKKIVRDGTQFENLIEDLLNFMYHDKEVTWEKTQTTHDGNKDFIGQKRDGTLMWAECKNFKDTLSLKVLSPTLVMAELNDIQEILIFSYSKINRQTQKKLLIYANKKEKKISYFDDLNLENLLFQFRTLLFPKYFPTFLRKDVTLEVLAPYVFSCSLPGLYHNKEMEIGTSSFCVKLNELIFTGIGIINNNYNEKLQIELSFDQYNDLKYMEVVDASIKNSTRFSWKKELELEPGEAVFNKLYFKPVKFKKEFRLPVIKVCFKNSKHNCQLIQFKKIECTYLFCTPLLGGEYIKALENLKKTTINKSKMSLAIFYGKSGVGKSRLLNEALSIYVQHHYHILNFTMDSSSKDSVWMLREIICFLYNLSPEMIVESLKEYTGYSVYGSDQAEIISLLQALIDNEYTNFAHLLRKNKYLIYEKLLSQKNVLIIDNIQFADSFFIDFIYDLCKYAKNYQRNTQMVLVLSYNVDYYINKSLLNLQLLLVELKDSLLLNVYLKEIKGMKQNNLSLGFLKELIHIEDDENDNSYMTAIVNKANHVPKHIENIVEYLLNKNILNIENNYFIVKDTLLFNSAIENLPESFSEIFKQRYTLFLQSEKLTDEEVILVLAAIHFEGCLNKEQVINFQLDMTVIQKLEQYGFINKNLNDEYQFNHDLYEQFFIENYLLEEIFIKYIISKNFSGEEMFAKWQRILIFIKQDNQEQETLEYIIDTLNEVPKYIPFKVKKYFFNQLINYLARYYKKVSNFDNYMECVRRLCLEVKNTLGSGVSKTLFDSVYKIIENINISKREKSLGYQHFVNEYCENLLQNDDVKVISIYTERIGFLSQCPTDNYKLLAELYNRMYVYYKNKKKEELVHRHLKKSMDLCKKYNLLGLEIENLYDEGNYYLYTPEKKEQLIDCWKNGYILFEKNSDKLEYLTLNSLKKKIQLGLLCNRYDQIQDDLETAFEYIETGKYNQQTLFFNASLYFLKAIYGLISDHLTIDEIQETLDRATQYYALKNNEKPYAIHFLYAKLARRKKQYQEMLLHCNYALKSIDCNHFYHDYFEKIIVDDCCYTIGCLKTKNQNIQLDYDDIIESLAKKCQFIENMTNTELTDYVQSFHSISNIVDKSMKDGYIY